MTIETGISEQLPPTGVLAQDSPSRRILQHLTSRWGVLVMLVLHDEVKRFGELKRAIGGVSERMLTQTLKSLEADQMVNRKVIHTAPPHVEYSLTPRGRDAARHIKTLIDWLEHETPAILSETEAGATSREDAPD